MIIEVSNNPMDPIIAYIIAAIAGSPFSVNDFFEKIGARPQKRAAINPNTTAI